MTLVLFNIWLFFLSDTQQQWMKMWFFFQLHSNSAWKCGWGNSSHLWGRNGQGSRPRQGKHGNDSAIPGSPRFFHTKKQKIIFKQVFSSSFLCFDFRWSQFYYYRWLYNCSAIHTYLCNTIHIFGSELASVCLHQQYHSQIEIRVAKKIRSWWYFCLHWDLNPGPFDPVWSSLDCTATLDPRFSALANFLYLHGLFACLYSKKIWCITDITLHTV